MVLNCVRTLSVVMILYMCDGRSDVELMLDSIEDAWSLNVLRKYQERMNLTADVLNHGADVCDVGRIMLNIPKLS